MVKETQPLGLPQCFKDRLLPTPIQGARLGHLVKIHTGRLQGLQTPFQGLHQRPPPTPDIHQIPPKQPGLVAGRNERAHLLDITLELQLPFFQCATISPRKSSQG